MTVMKYKYYLKSDIGTTRCQNQDSAFAMIACTSIGRVFFGAVCDGMGGTADGGFASKYVVIIAALAAYLVYDFIISG